MSYLMAVVMMLMVISPVLIPAIVSVIHACANWRRTHAGEAGGVGIARAAARP